MNPEVDLETALRRALRRDEPPEDFARRVLVRVAERRRSSQTRSWMAIAAMLLAGVLITMAAWNYETQRRVVAQRAGHDLELALKITSARLHATQRMMRRRSNGV